MGTAARPVQAAWRTASGRTCVEAAHADHLAQIALDQMHDLAGHRLHGDLDMQRLAGAVRPHAVGDQVALGEWLQQAGQKPGAASASSMKRTATRLWG